MKIEHPKSEPTSSALRLASHCHVSNIHLKWFSLSVLLLALQGSAFAQTYSIDWYKIAGGGDTSAGGTYTVSGTVGQHDAGGPMTGGNYSLTGGFWSLISVVQTAGLPNLTIAHTGNNVVVAWPNAGTVTV